jgi:erythritol transport system ATP-binding protein
MSGVVPACRLEAREITRRFPGTTALDGVNFRIERGRVHALIGENGAGKSTLVKILAGVDSPSSGELRFDGRAVRFGSTRDARACGIDIIHQELQLFPELSVTENVFVGRERLTRWHTIDRAAEETAAAAVLARLGQSLSPRILLGQLPLGQQQIVEIARALVHDTQVLMMDEPTSALTASEIPTLFRLIRELTREGVAIVYISHRLEELLAIADHVTVLRDGRVVGEAPRSDVDVPWIVRHMTGRQVETEVNPPVAASEAPVLTVTDLRLRPASGRAGLDGVSLQVRAGEILGLYGLMGAGRTELLEALMGVHPEATGAVHLGTQDVTRLDVGARIAAGFALVPEDRQVSGLVPALSVLRNMTLSSLERLSRGGYVSPARETAAATPWLERLRIKAPSLEAPVWSLSGGNQQKVIIARGAMTDARVLLLDEPTRGVDVAAKAEIVETMRALARDGLGIIFASSDISEIQTAATRALVMARGRVTADLPAGAFNADALAAAASAAPDAAGTGAGHAVH